MKSSDLIKMLKKDGWKLTGVRGSHHKFKKAQKTVVVPHPKKDLKIGLVKQILKDAGLR